jgi:predicted nucleotidyltransferase component of viral defense system
LEYPSKGDIDLDYLRVDSREEMLHNREVINTSVSRFMKISEYTPNLKSKNPHSLDSLVYNYVNAGGNRDNLKIEINYSMRAHIFPAEEMKIKTDYFTSEYRIKCLSAIEIFGSKINALLSRAAARDLYDVYNMIKFDLFDEEKQELLRKCVVFYSAVSAREINKNFDSSAIDKITKYKIRTDLLPVITKKDTFDLDKAKVVIKKYIKELMDLTPQEKEFLRRFENKEYAPELLFYNKDILERIKMHPMALWKIKQ